MYEYHRVVKVERVVSVPQSRNATVSGNASTYAPIRKVDIVSVQGLKWQEYNPVAIQRQNYRFSHEGNSTSLFE